MKVTGEEIKIEGLKPCPFCGGKVKLVDLSKRSDGLNVGTGNYHIYCEKCKCDFDVNKRTKLKTKDFWNARYKNE